MYPRFSQVAVCLRACSHFQTPEYHLPHRIESQHVVITANQSLDRTEHELATLAIWRQECSLMASHIAQVVRRPAERSKARDGVPCEHCFGARRCVRECLDRDLNTYTRKLPEASCGLGASCRPSFDAFVGWSEGLEAWHRPTTWTAQCVFSSS